MMISEITGKEYSPSACCFLLNPKQTALYMKNGAPLMDILIGGDDKLVYVFTKEDTGPLYEKWKAYELV